MSSLVFSVLFPGSVEPRPERCRGGRVGARAAHSPCPTFFWGALTRIWGSDLERWRRRRPDGRLRREALPRAWRMLRGRGTRTSRDPRVGRALCCVIAPAGAWVVGWGLLPGSRGGVKPRVLAPPPRQVPVTWLSPCAWPPYLLSAGVGPAGGRRPVALRGCARAGGGDSGLSANTCLRAAAAVSPHRPGRE